MANINITTISSKGQVVIPQNMRKELHPGEKLVIIEDAGLFIIRRASEFAATLREDIEFARRTEAAYLEVEGGKYRQMSASSFLKKVRRHAAR